MTDNYPKNSLLGQLKEEGFINKEGENLSEHLPFGILTGNIDSPFYEVEPKITDEKEIKLNPQIIKKRLNDLDLNIFQEGSFINIDDRELTDNEKIKKIKMLIKKLDEKIFMLEDSDDENLLSNLKSERQALVKTLNFLNEETNGSKDALQDAFKVKEIAGKMHLREKFKKLEEFIFKYCPIIHRIYLVRHALNKLIMLNESVKELMLKKTPYGEQEGKYNDFITYLSCANVIHAKLTKKI